MPTPQITTVVNTGNTTPNYTEITLTSCSLQVSGAAPVFFPTSEVNIDFEQRIGIHQHMNVIGAQVESLARGPIRFHIKALFYNGTRAGKGERWGILFPDQHNAVLALLLDEANNNQIKVFTHPVLGNFNVKVVKASTKTEAQIRNGSAIEFDLIEANTSLAPLPASANTIASGNQAASDFDANAYDVKLQNILDANFAAGFHVQQISLSQALGQITGSLSQISLNINRVSGLITQAVYQCQQLVAATQGVSQAYQNLETTINPFTDANVLLNSNTNGISQILGIKKPSFNVPTLSIAAATVPFQPNRLTNQQSNFGVNYNKFPTSVSPSNTTNSVPAPALTSVGDCLQTASLANKDLQLVLASLLLLQQQAQSANQNNTKIFLVVTPITLGQLSTQLKTSVETLLSLNTSLAGITVLPYGTIVIYPSRVGS